MKAEPLKDKLLKKDWQKFGFYREDDIKSAVEWLKEELKKNMIYLHRGDERYLFNQIDKAFSDLQKVKRKK